MKRILPLLALVAPLSLSAQSGTTLAPYVAADDGVRGSPVVVGATLSREVGWTALRAGVGMDALAAPQAESGARVGVVSADVDGLVYLGNPAGSAPVIPYALAGVGVRVLSGATAGSTAASWSYGGGLRTPVTERISLEGEARYREPLGAGMMEIPAEVAAGWEFRFGVNLRVSGGASARVPAPVLPARTAAAPAGSSAGARRRIAERALDTADDYLGVRYTWGGNTPDEGFDCSGFVRFVFARQGIELPRVSREQARAGTPLPLELGALEPGDLIAFASTPGGEVDHIAIYAGGGRIIHSSRSGKGVRMDDLNSQRGGWYRNHMVAARRVIDEAAGWSWGDR